MTPGSAAWVWQVNLDDPRWEVESAVRSLSAVEKARADRGLAAVRRRRIILRAALRQVLGELLRVSPKLVPLDDGSDRPQLRGQPRRRPIEISCSASDTLGLIALSDGIPLGVDVERHRDEDARRALGEDWLSGAERAAIAQLPPTERLPAITRCWTHKEAVLKGHGMGLRRSPATVVTPVAPGGRIGAWWLMPVPVPPGYLASLAVRSRVSLVPVPVPVTQGKHAA